MVLDINLFRVAKGGNPDQIRESQRRRHADVTMVDKVIELDDLWVKQAFQTNQLNKQQNAFSKDFGKLKKEGKPTDELSAQIAEVKQQIEQSQNEEQRLIKERDSILFKIGNLVPDDVPVSKDEDNNAVRFITPGDRVSQPLNHIAVFAKIGGTDCERGVKVAGNRGYFLSGVGALLNQALIQYAQQFLSRRGFIIMQTPFFLEKSVMERCAQLADFDEQLYKVSGEGNEKYLIATSEQSLCSYFMDEQIDFNAFNKKYAGWRQALNSKYPEITKTDSNYLKNFEPLTPEELESGVILFAGYSSCFRKEVGKHGQDTLGIFRIHQFEKVEQLVLCKPELSARLQYTMINLAMEFYESLNLPFRVVDIVSGALNDAAARKFDLEAWFPAGQQYRELVSCSNCTDYQARNLNIKFQGKKDREFCHMLNSTLTATERTLCCIVENWQSDGKLIIPDVLRQFMMGIESIPYIVEEKK